MQNTLKILITDDSLISRNKIKKSLSVFTNIEITEAIDGLDALNKIENINFDFLILDILMPNLNGIEILQNLNKLNIKIPTVFVTADIQQTTIKKCYDLGAITVLGKPLDEQKLISIVQNLINLVNY